MQFHWCAIQLLSLHCKVISQPFLQWGSLAATSIHSFCRCHNLCVSLQQREISCLRLYSGWRLCVWKEKEREERGRRRRHAQMHKHACSLAALCPCSSSLLLSRAIFIPPFHFFLSLFAPFLLHFSACLSLYPFVITSSASYTAFRILIFSFLSFSFSFSFSFLLLYQALLFWDSSLSLFPFPFLSVSIRFNASAYCEFRRKQIAAILDS